MIELVTADLSTLKKIFKLDDIYGMVDMYAKNTQIYSKLYITNISDILIMELSFWHSSRRVRVFVVL